MPPMTPEQTETKEVAADLAENLEVWRTAFSVRMDNFERALGENTVATTRVETNTKDLVDLLMSFKGAMKVLEMFGKLAKPLGYVAGLVAACGTAWWAWRGGK